MESKFFTFLDPILNLIDKGSFFKQPFKWLYTIIASVSLAAPIILLAILIDNNVFKYSSAKSNFIIILFLLLVCFIMWINSQIWWNRSKKVSQLTTDKDKFFTIPLFSNFIQTSGESLGFLTVVTGVICSIFSIIDKDFYSAMHIITPFTGFHGIIYSIIYGFFVIVVARVSAEALTALVDIANNTRKNNPNESNTAPQMNNQRYQQNNPTPRYQNPNNGYQQGNPNNGYQQGNPNNGYQQGNPNNGYRQGNPNNGYRQGNPNNGYNPNDPNTRYQ